MRFLRSDSPLAWKRGLGELALIVCGVLIALAVDSWWQGREERQREAAYLEQLLADLRETETRLERTIAGDSAMLDLVERNIERALNGPLPPPDSFSLPTGYSQFRPLTGASSALVRNGDLQLLENDSIRFQVIAYVALIDATEAVLRHTESLIWNSTEQVLFGLTRHSRSPAGPRGPSSPAWGSVDVASALGDPAIVSALRIQAAASRNRVRNLQRLEEPTARLIRALDGELSGN